MSGFRKDPGLHGGLLSSYAQTLGTVISRQRTENALAAAKAEAEIANRAKSEFLANISHELRTPLNAIIGFAQVLKDNIGGGHLSERQHGYAVNIHSAGQHLLGLISEILDIAKIESGSVQLDIEEHDLGDIIADCTALVADRYQEKGLLLKTTLEPNLPPVIADRRRMKQIFINLLSNAHKFTDEGGRVDIGARRSSAGGVDIVVKDSGIGMTHEEMAQAMQPFGQIQSAYARNHGGTGLGLPITKGLVELHGGELRMTSKPGVGTSIRISLPSSCIVAEQRQGSPSRAQASI